MIVLKACAKSVENKLIGTIILGVNLAPRIRQSTIKCHFQKVGHIHGITCN